jgi:thioredoxin-like negative regulator of GroEL
MLASILDLLNLGSFFFSPIFLIVGIFQLWMFIDAVRRREWLWAAFIVFFWGLAPLWYYLYVYRDGSSATSGFQLPGAVDRKRIKQLQAQIHHLDKPHHYSQLGDIYFQQGKLVKAEECYRAAMERDPEDIDTRAHYGQCLLRAKRPAEARPLLEGVVAENPKHDYGYSQMALAETYMALNETDKAFALWKVVTEHHSYARAKVQLAEIYIDRNQPNLAITELADVISDDVHAPTFQRRRDRVWVSRAKNLLKKLK